MEHALFTYFGTGRKVLIFLGMFIFVQLGYGQTLTVDIVADSLQYCSGSGGITLTTNVQGGIPPYSYSWFPSTSLNNDTILNPIAAPAQSTWYSIVVIDANLDSSVDSVFVEVIQAPVIAISPVFDQCFPGNQFAFSLIDSSGLDSIEWMFDVSASILSSPSFTPSGIQYQTPGLKNVQVIAYQGNCQSNMASDDFLVSNPQVEILSDTTACQGDTLPFSGFDSSTPGNAGDIISWQWLFSNGTNGTGQNINQVFSVPGVYVATLQAIDSIGCSTIDSQTVVVTALPTVSYSFSVNECNEVSFVNNSSPGNYLWDFGDGTTDTSSNPMHVYSVPGTYFVMLSVSNECGTIDVPQSLTILPACVWPGDANNDLVANNVDLLSVGLSYGLTGPTRANASTNWIGQGSDNWNDTLANGTNVAYVDADGNGIIDDGDTLAILQNYGLTHNKKEEESEVGTILYFDTTGMSSPIMVGSQLEIPIMLGTPTEPADSVYGIAFTITYEMDLVDSATAALLTSPSWIGNDVLRIEKDFFLDGELDGAICRKDHVDTTHHGQIARATFVMIDDIAKQVLYDTLRLGFKDVYLIRADGSFIPVTTLPAQIILFQDDIINSLPNASFPLKLYPNPANKSVMLEIGLSEWCTVELMDLSGKVVMKRIVFREKSNIHLQELPAGMYLLKVSHNSGSVFQKLQVL